MDARERDTWREADRLFQELLGLDAAKRAEWLAEHAIDGAVRERLDQLLACAARPHPLLDAGGQAASPAASLSGRRIGDWRLRELIGEGGMGTVYRAERVGCDFEQQAAVKLLALALRGEAAQARFQRERRILAQLQHPHIAGLIDAGVAADGTPYLAMTLLRGERIDRYCEERRLPPRVRVGLMLQVCAAVGHAHRQLVVHRDIKPGNILVDAEGHATLLDFGIAHLLEDSDADGGHTLTRAFTPDYAAPEQHGGANGVGVEVDVHGLGAVLHRLLTGMPPQRDAGGALITPSRVARRSSAEAAALLRGDLDAILSCALAAEPARRYRSVDLLAADLEAWLEHRPVLARRAGTWMRLGKFLRRHPAASAATAVAALAMAAGAIQFIASHRNLQRHAAALQTVTRFQAQMLADIDAETVGTHLREALQGTLSLELPVDPALRSALARIDYTGLAVDMLEEALLARSAVMARSTFDGQPRIAATLLQQVSSSYRDLGRLEQAGALQQEALALLRGSVGADDRLTLSSMREELKLLRVAGSADAEARHREVLAAHVRALGSDDSDTHLARAALAQWMMEDGGAAGAEGLLREAAAALEAQRGPADPDVAAIRANLAFSVSTQGRFEEALPLHRHAVKGLAAAFGAEHAFTLTATNNLAYVLGRSGREDEAEALYALVYEARRRRLGAMHQATLMALNNHATMLRRNGDPAGAEPRHREAYEGLADVLGAGHATTLHVGTSLARDRIDLQRFGEAAPLLATILERMGSSAGGPARARAEALLGRCRAAQGRPEEADQLYERAWAAMPATRGEERREVAAWAVQLHHDGGADAARLARWRQRESGSEPLAREVDAAPGAQ